ncbi:MAG: hypothetical protein CV087_23700 [Candidatus Brocadia sp. WS118]|nr:MAG: hypothetical protein CV087_23700 [Candidatus Brocadia sp. WS118]
MEILRKRDDNSDREDMLYIRKYDVTLLGFGADYCIKCGNEISELNLYRSSENEYLYFCGCWKTIEPEEDEDFEESFFSDDSYVQRKYPELIDDLSNESDPYIEDFALEPLDIDRPSPICKNCFDTILKDFNAPRNWIEDAIIQEVDDLKRLEAAKAEFIQVALTLRDKIAKKYKIQNPYWLFPDLENK